MQLTPRNGLSTIDGLVLACIGVKIAKSRESPRHACV